MAEDIRLRFARLRWLVTKLESNHTQIDEMMFLHIQDGLGAMAYGQYGGSTPDPTGRTVVAPDGSLRVWNRDNVAETDRRHYWADLAQVEKLLEGMDDTRRRYMSANLEIRNRLDPTDFCSVHFALHLYEGHRRTKGNLCTICGKFYDENHREPTGTEADYFHRHGRWPHKPVDPKR